MCGIAGEYVLRADRRVEEENVVPMISVLAHRGPDEWGYYVNPARTVMLLHTRLSIVDLERGRSPRGAQGKLDGEEDPSLALQDFDDRSFRIPPRRCS